MPRTRKTQSGVPAQSGPPVAGQTYGHGADQQQLDRAMPKPNLVQSGAQHLGGQVVQGARQGMYDVNAARNQTMGTPGDIEQGAMRYDPQAAMAAAQGMNGLTGLLTQPTQRPNEPITHGLTRGPGAGPEVLGMQQGSPTGDLFRRLSAELGDPLFAELANRIRA